MSRGNTDDQHGSDEKSCAGVGMRAVVYADDMEPITVIDLSAMAERALNEGKRVQFDVLLPLTLSDITALTAQDLSDLGGMTTVEIFAERIIRSGREHMMIFTRDEESALLLKCAFLPGQQAELQERMREEFDLGFMKALGIDGGV